MTPWCDLYKVLQEEAQTMVVRRLFLGGARWSNSVETRNLMAIWCFMNSEYWIHPLWRAVLCLRSRGPLRSWSEPYLSNFLSKKAHLHRWNVKLSLDRDASPASYWMKYPVPHQRAWKISCLTHHVDTFVLKARSYIINAQFLVDTNRAFFVPFLIKHWNWKQIPRSLRPWCVF